MMTVRCNDVENPIVKGDYYAPPSPARDTPENRRRWVETHGKEHEVAGYGLHVEWREVECFRDELREVYRMFSTGRPWDVETWTEDYLQHSPQQELYAGWLQEGA